MHKTVIFLVFLTLWVIGCDNSDSNNVSTDKQTNTQKLLINKWVLSDFDLNYFLTEGRGKNWAAPKQEELYNYMKMAVGKMYFELEPDWIYKSTPAPNVIVQGKWELDVEKKELSMKANQMTEGASKTTVYTIKDINTTTLKVNSDENMLLTFKVAQ